MHKIIHVVDQFYNRLLTRAISLNEKTTSLERLKIVSIRYIFFKKHFTLAKQALSFVQCKSLANEKEWCVKLSVELKEKGSIR